MNRKIEMERWAIAESLSKNFHINGEGWDASDFEWAADCLLQDGYRKSTDVAREIAEEITRYLRLNEDIALKCKEENGEQNREYWKGKLSAFKQIRGFIDIEIRKKHESEGER